MRRLVVLLMFAVFLSPASGVYSQKLESPSWFISRTDLKLELPEGKKKGDHFIEINRSFAGPKEEALLRTAEAVYPSKQLGPRYASFIPRAEMPVNVDYPEWWKIPDLPPGKNNTRPIPYGVTAAAVRYYYDLSLRLRRNRWEKGHHTPVYSSRLTYKSKIELQTQWSYQEKSFTDVYVADLEMNWEEVCGNLCGLFFSRKQHVVLDAAGTVLDLIIDPSENPPVTIASVVPAGLEVEATIAYIRNQEKHHHKKTFQEEFIEILRKHGIEYDERYVWG